MEDVINEFCEYVENRKETGSKLDKKVYNWLNNDNLGSILKDNVVFYVEKTCRNALIYDYALNYIKKYMLKYHNVKYMYDVYK